MRNKREFFAAICIAGGMAWSAAIADDVTVGWRSAESRAVADGETATFSDRLTVGDGGVFCKLGAGTLTLPLSQVDRQRPYAVDALEGTLALAPGAASADATPPTFIASKAAFWVDATPGNGLQTEDDDGTTRVTRWCDVREADPANRAYPSALPGIVATGAANAQTDNPVVTNVYGNAAVYFGGLGSGQYMAFKTAADAALSYGKVFHFFIVHGISSTWGPVLGHTENSGSGGFRVNTDSLTAYTDLTAGHFDLWRGDQHGGLWTSRFTLNGQTVDLFKTYPRRGFQLLSGTVGDHFQSYNNFFRQRTVVKAVGGDFLSEAILFTNLLTEAECVAVERYLMAKWNLRDGATEIGHLDRDVGRIGIAAGASVTAAPAAGESVGPIALSGEGTVTKSGAGTLVIGPSGDKPPFAGTFNLAAGKVAVRGGSVPALSVAGGQTLSAGYTYGNTSYGGSTLAKDTGDGTDITLTSGGTAGTVRKTGDAEARIVAASNDVKSIAVEGGSLVLSAPVTTSLYRPGNGATSLDVPITNADFEQYFIDNPGAMVNFSGLSCGWTGSGYNPRWLSSGNGNWSTFCKVNTPPPSGEGVLLLKTAAASAWTTVDLPQDGTYEFSCVSTIRKQVADGNYYPMGIWVGTGSNLSGATQVGTLLSGLAPWPRTYCRFTATAGQHVIGFKVSNGSLDDAYLIDDVRLRLVAEATPEVAFAVPNGDFETFTNNTPHYLCLHAAVGAAGWTLDSSESANFNGANSQKVPAVSIASPLTFADSGAKPTYMSACADMTYGSSHLAFIGANGKASTTFVAPAGTYRLKGRLAGWGSNYYRYNGSGEYGATVAPVIEAVIRRADGTDVSLGTVMTEEHLFRDVVWATAFTLDEAEEITLTVRQTSTGAGLLDDLVFVAAEAADPGELVTNGGVEEGMRGVTRSVGSFGVAKSERIRCSASPQYFGYSAYEGDVKYVLGNNSTCAWTLNVPVEGLYRLRFAAHSRTDARTYYGRNPIRATLKDSSGTEKAIVYVKPFGLNFNEYSALFRVPAPGNYTLTLSGTAQDSAHTDRRSYIDGVSVRKVVGAVADVPDVPQKMKLSVAEGALLQLDFPGTLKTGPVTLGGVVYIGTIDAATFPDYVSGMGTLEAIPSGTIVIFR